MSEETTGIQIGSEAPEAAEPTAPQEPTEGQPTSDEPKLYAGKFKTVEAMESSYLEAQKKIHDTHERFSTMSIQEFVESSGLDVNDLAANFSQHGHLTDDQYKAFSEHGGMGKEWVDSYLAGQQARAMLDTKTAEVSRSRAVELSGGEQQLQNILGWAKENMPSDRRESLNDRLDDPREMEGALKEILYDYSRQFGGATKDILSGTPAPNTSSGYTSSSEVIAAMKKVSSQGYMDEATTRRLSNTPLEFTQGA